MSNEFEGKVAIVTGAASGMGRSAAYAFAKRGVRVVVADVDVKGGEETVKHVKDQGGEAIFIKTDVALSAEVQNMVNKTVETYGSIDFAYNNAGVTRGTGIPTGNFKEEDWDFVHGINLKGIFLCMKYEIQQMLKQGTKASIVNTASISGLSPHPAGPCLCEQQVRLRGTDEDGGPGVRQDKH